MNNKSEIVFTFPACMGGVASFNYNIINNSHLIKNFRSKVVLIKAKEDNRPLFLETFTADEVITFNYSHKENQFFVAKRLNELLGSAEGAIVTDNALTIAAARLFNNPKTVFHLIHDYFYVNANVRLKDMVDVAIAHSSFFSDAVFASQPSLFARRSFYIPYGVDQVANLPEKNHDVLNLVFLGRLDSGKGVMLLHEMETILRKKNIAVNWTIIGKGPLKSDLIRQWEGKTNVSFHEPDTKDEIYRLLKEQDAFVFPTMFEGTPVSILECLANGVVTITNDLPGGIRDIVTEGIGFRCALGDVNGFVDKIELLHNDRNLLRQMQDNCLQLAKANYDIQKNADNYFTLFMQFEKYRRKNINCSPGMSLLDKKFFPNWLVKIIRKVKNR
ncbi:glycosyltransferase family 4 protein [Pinibacter aurantiacus]|uniref:Glycosyltransferase family 4 protein n=1 Tax=Pinibacter aurantiacus TaxID=2851599 RepID=A0A9E2W836_9BACT|nr:glycosyltransferase family 4 protein [Pinibacter aurantiacus]MBV4357841.1 glycosyltransferase family 4 protein [Pinibacter aurantiacus]